jgi:hypothetical protein
VGKLTKASIRSTKVVYISTRPVDRVLSRLLL